MDYYKTVTGDVDAMKSFDNHLGGLGRQTVNFVKDRVNTNSKHDKADRVIEGSSHYFKTDYELFVEHHNMLMQEYAATQIHLQTILNKKNEIKSISKLTELCAVHQCSNIGELYVEKQDDEYVLQCFMEFQQDLENDLNLKKTFNQFADSFEAYRYNLDYCNKLSGLDKPFTLEQPNPTQLNFIVNSGIGIKQTILDYQKKLNEQQTTVDKFKNDATFTALFPLATNDKNLFTTAATEIYVVQSPRYQDYLKVLKSELKVSQESGHNTFDKHYKSILNNEIQEKAKDSSQTYSLNNSF